MKTAVRKKQTTDSLSSKREELTRKQMILLLSGLMVFAVLLTVAGIVWFPTVILGRFMLALGCCMIPALTATLTYVINSGNPRPR